MSIILIEATWDSDSVGNDLDFGPEEVHNYSLINKVFYLEGGDLKTQQSVVFQYFDQDGWFQGTNFQINPDSGSYVYVQVRAIEGFVEDSLLLHNTVGQYQAWDELEDYQPTLDNFRLQLIA